MISVQQNKSSDELVINGVIKEGDIYHNICCNGFDFEVIIVFPDEDRDGDTVVYGICHNKDCKVDYGGIYHGVSNFLQDDLIDRLIEQLD